MTLKNGVKHNTEKMTLAPTALLTLTLALAALLTLALAPAALVTLANNAAL